MKILTLDGLTQLVDNIKAYVQANTNDDVIQKVYPVGSIYMSVSNAPPSELFGFGEWEQLKDTFLLCAGDSYNGGSTGGEAEHTLAINEMPSHSHQIKTDMNVDAYNIEWPAWTEWTTGWTQQANTPDAPPTYVTYTGGGEAHNNMPPYITVFAWKRVA